MRSIILVACSFWGLSLAASAVQDCWIGGPGVPGPVIDWGDCYSFSSGIMPLDSSLILAGGVLTVPEKNQISGGLLSPACVYAFDLDQDGDMDVFTCSEITGTRVSWWENLDGTGQPSSWFEHVIDTNFQNTNSVRAADIDGDGDIDVIGSSRLTWWENANGMGTAWGEHVIGNEPSAHSAIPVDMDNDGITDVAAACGYDEVAWWKNDDGSGFFWTRYIVSEDFDNSWSICSCDFDQDGDNDIAGAAFTDGEITWWENDGGSGVQWIEHILDVDVPGATSVAVGDPDGDGDQDIIGTSRFDDTVYWWENPFPAEEPWVRHLVCETIEGPHSASSVDLDADGDEDILCASRYESTISWLENVTGTGMVWEEWTFQEDYPSVPGVCAADIDGDGYLDIAGSSQDSSDVSWWKVCCSSTSYGFLESSILNVGEVSEWQLFQRICDTPVGTSTGFQFRSSSDPETMGAWSDTIWASEADLSGVLSDSTEFVQYRALFFTDDTLTTPTLEQVSISYSIASGTGDSAADFGLSPCSNPCSGDLRLIAQVQVPGILSVDIFDMAGRIRGSYREFSYPGTHTIEIYDLEQGLYLCRMTSGDLVGTAKVMVLR